MRHQKKNYAGEIISGVPQLRKAEYGTGEIKSGVAQAKWGYHGKNADNDGFDKSNVEENGHYKMEIQLPRGTVLLRYGNERGTYTAPDGTKYEELSLPYIQETVEFHKYFVEADGLWVKCIVNRGKVAPMFDEVGGGIQYQHNKSIGELVKEKALGRINL